MTPLLTLLTYAALITAGAILVASQIRFKTWRPEGLRAAMGNRHNAPASSPLAQRADRAAANTLENFMLFAALALTAHAAGLETPRVLMGAQCFIAARLVYLPVYYLGIAYLRSLVWAAGVLGMGMVVFELLTH